MKKKKTLTGALAQHHIRQIDQVREQHVILDLQEAEAVLGGQLARFHLLQHALHQIGDLHHVRVHLAEQPERLRQVLLRLRHIVVVVECLTQSRDKKMPFLNKYSQLYMQPLIGRHRRTECVIVRHQNINIQPTNTNKKMFAYPTFNRGAFNQVRARACT